MWPRLQWVTDMIFRRGDVVRVTHLPKSMSHFEKLERAIIEYSYGKRYGGGKTKKKDQYSLMYQYTRPNGKTVWTTVAWYDAEQLELLEARPAWALDVLDEEGDS